MKVHGTKRDDMGGEGRTGRGGLPAVLAGLAALTGMGALLRAAGAPPARGSDPGDGRAGAGRDRAASGRASDRDGGNGGSTGDRAPGDEGGRADAVLAGIPTYTIGLGLAALLTAASFGVAYGGGFVWGPGVPVVLVVLAIAQMGVHVVFFMHITTGPDSLNNVMALAFGVLIVLLLMCGSLWIMYHLNRNMMDMHNIPSEAQMMMNRGQPSAGGAHR